MLTSTTPSEWARQLVRGAYDLHVHVAPDVMRRRITDIQLARRYWDAGLAGFVLKSHYVPTAERAAVVNEALGGEVRVLGALALNAAVGGMNPLAVEVAAREGTRRQTLVERERERRQACGDRRVHLPFDGLARGADRAHGPALKRRHQ